MNATEERLRDALKTVGDTIGPEDVPEPRFAARRRRFPRPVMALAAVAASAAVAVGGAAVGGAFSSGGTTGLLAPPSPSGGAMPKISVFLCTKTSANPYCRGKGTTQPEKQEIQRVLEALPPVGSVEFENKQEAFERFKKGFENDERFRRSVETGDVPESFRVGLAPGADVKKVTAALVGMPGVDAVIVEGR
ncbi:permease-like cell division protein FtsX [Actinomadura chokoriensis]|uniref:Permease-like cell division protein FtsX n=1 Tax=Actinomadura chokoriensis TaxID=454156 RepID=A0ABV4QUW3_9ACTN